MIWKNNDLNRLEMYYANSSNIALATYLGRSVDSVEHKARRENLSKRDNYNKSHSVVVSRSGRSRRVNG